MRPPSAPKDGTEKDASLLWKDKELYKNDWR